MGNGSARRYTPSDCQGAGGHTYSRDNPVPSMAGWQVNMRSSNACKSWSSREPYRVRSSSDTANQVRTFSGRCLCMNKRSPFLPLVLLTLLVAGSQARAQSPIPYSSLRQADQWTTATWHPAVEFFRASSRGPTSDEACRRAGGLPSGLPRFVNSEWAALRQGVLYGRHERHGLIVSVGYGVAQWWGGHSQRSCLFSVR